MARPDDLLRRIETDARRATHIEAIRRLPAVAARYGDWPAALDRRLVAAAGALGIERPYVHQAAAAAAALDGEHVAVATATASGKSLCYLLPVLQAALRGEARALLLFPTKALAHDQLAALRRWDDALADVDLRPAAYDGDTPSGARPAIRREARAVLTNPDMLHTGILPHHTAWAPFLENLAFVVVDEMHVYRGVFGSHVANVLRRLRRVARFHGSAPRFVLTSATIANPAELGRLLAGAPVKVVDDDGAPRSARTFAFYNPPVVDERLNLRRSPLLEAEGLARHFVAGGVQTIVFARARQTAELLVRYINEGLGEDPQAGEKAGPAAVRGYRGGYTATERRAIEAELREGRLRGVVATNALELGVDIGELGACIMTGYPGTIASTWQQAGRAGRRDGHGVAILVAGSSPLDQFIVRHPDYFFGRSPEHARLDPDNLLVLLDHARCAAFELPFDAVEAALPFGADPVAEAARAGDLLAEGAAAPHANGADGNGADGNSANGNAARGDRYGAAEAAPPVGALLAVLEAQRVVRRVEDTWYWLADAYPAEAVSLRSAGPDTVAIVAPRGGDEEDGYDVLGTVERASAATMVHPGAVYLHDGAAYSVVRLDWEAGRAVVAPTDGAIYTRASASVDVRPTRVDDVRRARGAEVSHGELEVTSRATGYRKIRFRTHETVGWGDIDLPEHQHLAGGYWFTLDDATVEGLRALGRWNFDPSGDRGPNWAAQRDRARARDGYRCRMCLAPERPDRTHDVHHIRPFRDFGWTGGAGDAYVMANDLDNLITLCRGCHRVAERALGLHGGLSGVGYALGHVAALHLMCDSRDIGVKAETHAAWSKKPTVVVYERAAAGLGFGRALFELHEAVLGAAATLVADCPCAGGCPSCVGAPDSRGPVAKTHALAVLEALGAGRETAG